ncbi:MAG: hypothetical protein H6672_05565 [Anaerolineaceae bacterium]|nr:hypothetical protein [Anaerolineaceae bacterium]
MSTANLQHPPVPSQKSVFPRWLLMLLVGLAPVLVTGLLMLLFQLDLGRFIPRVWNDQVYYWSQINTFRAVGFDGGYYTIREVPAAVSFFHFGAWGFTYPALVGSVARLTGWQMNTPVILNGVLLTLSLWGFLAVSRFDRRQIVFTLLAVLSVTPVLFFIPTVSQESFHQSVAILLAALVLALFRRERPWPVGYSILFLVIFSGVVLVRLSWAYLVLPVLLLAFRRWSVPRLLVLLVGVGVWAVALVLFFQMTSAPAASSMFKSITDAVSRFGNNLVALLTPKTFLAPFSDIFLTIQYGLALVLVSREAIKPFRHRSRATIRRQLAEPANWEMPFHVVNLGGLLLLALTLYITGGYYRVFAPHLLLTLLVLVGFRRYRIASLVMFVSLIGAILFFQDYGRFIPHNFEGPREGETETLRTTFSQTVIYHADALTPWCNTVLLPVDLLADPTLFMPEGIGVSFFFSGYGLQFPLHSQYLLLDAETDARLRDQLHVETLAELGVGTLYRNLDADCPPNESP